MKRARRGGWREGTMAALLCLHCDPITLGSLATDGSAGSHAGSPDAGRVGQGRPSVERMGLSPNPQEPAANGVSSSGEDSSDSAMAELDAGGSWSSLSDGGGARAIPSDGGSGLSSDASDGGALPSFSERPSCVAGAASCGERRESCCEAALVPRGSIAQGDEPEIAPSYVSSFYLDNYEVTIGRFARFVRDYDAWRSQGNPETGAGALPAASETGWQRRWDAALPASGDALWESLQQCDGFPEMSVLEASETPESVAERGQRPVNCLTWFEAHLFCTWDGARLPTELEWEYAAAGGQEERTYPWGDAPEPEPERAVFDCNFVEGPADAGSRLGCLPDELPSVGFTPAGRGRFGQEDLAGSVAEWVLDGAEQYAGGCVDCVEFESDAQRMFRGGHWMSRSPSELRATTRNSTDPGSRFGFLGLRCARRNYR